MIGSIAEYFMTLVKIDSESKNEKEIANKLKIDLEEMGAAVSFDNSEPKTGSNTGNLYAYFPGTVKKEPILFCAHMDTVQPGIGVKPSIQDGKIVTDGTTILGADDKSGIAQIIWAIKKLKKNNIPHPPIEILFTVCEEIGLLGAKFADYSKLKSQIGLALDSSKVGCLLVGAPAQNSLEFEIFGLEAHAGVEPEKGLNAIQIAAEAISQLQWGRIDKETTCNIGTITGGKATNIIPNRTFIKAEVRSHNRQKLDSVTNEMINIFKKTCKKYKTDNFEAKVEVKCHLEYEHFRLTEEDTVIQLAKKACETLELEHLNEIGGGGSDANIFNANGMRVAIAGTGMNGYHTVHENISLKDLENGADWIFEIIKEYSK
jgi:tripeptide aminopeptidase